MECLICGAGSTDRPSINKNEPYCSDLCRKRYNGEIPLRLKDMETMSRELLPFVVEIGQHAYLRRTEGFGPIRRRDKVEKKGLWSKIDGRPRWHRHLESGLAYPTFNATQTGDDFEWWACVECGATKTGWHLAEGGDE